VFAHLRGIHHSAHIQATLSARLSFMFASSSLAGLHLFFEVQHFNIVIHRACLFLGHRHCSYVVGIDFVSDIQFNFLPLAAGLVCSCPFCSLACFVRLLMQVNS
jgi:hypothetical protein